MSGPRLLTPQPLTAAAFAPYGRVIEADHATSYLINDGLTRRYHALALAEVGDGQAGLSIFRGRPQPWPIRIQMLEQHPLGTQAFVPLQPHPWLAVVASAPEPDACVAFLCRGDQGLQLGVGVWHHPLLVLAATQDFLVVDRIGPGANLAEHRLTEAVLIETL